MDVPVWVILVILLCTPATVPLIWLGAFILKLCGVKFGENDEDNSEAQDKQRR